MTIHNNDGIPLSSYSTLTERIWLWPYLREYDPNCSTGSTSEFINSQIGTPPSVSRPPPAAGEGPSRITVPLCADVDPDYRVELENKDGGVGLHIENCKGKGPTARIESIRKEIKQADELLFPPLQFVDRALFPGERHHVRPAVPVPKRYERVTLAVLLSAIVLKQREWMKQFKEKELLGLWDTEHPVWVAWNRKPTLEPVWIVALRRTLPDERNRVYWFPEIELRF